MIGKILKVELFTLFLLTLFAFCAFYYKESMPDNYLAISSNANEMSFVSYYFSSLVVWVGYYTGPWLFFSFIGYTLFYSFSFSKREFQFDVVNIGSLLIFIMLATYVIHPGFLGKGLYLFLSTVVDFWSGIALAFISLIIFLAGSFREKFKYTMLNLFHIAKTAPTRSLNYYRRLNVGESTKRSGLFFRNKFQKANLRISDVLKKEKKSDEKMGAFQASLINPPAIVENEVARDVLKRPVDLKNISTFSNIEKPVQQNLNINLKNVSVKKDPRYQELVSGFGLIEANRTLTPHPDNEYFEEIMRRLETKLGEFNIEGRIINVLKGPVVDTFELELGAGVQVAKVSNRQQDLSLALYGAPIRIVYPMKGRSTIGIEVPRSPREYIYLDQVIQSDEFSDSKYKLPIGMGKDAFGEIFVADLASMPHMLVAGMTGAGKSVFINSLLISLLVKKSPEEMKLILIDPKQLELAPYGELPHLLMPVVIDPPTTSIVLLWAIQEMERRYSILKEFGVRNISGFNDKLKIADQEMLANIHRFYENEPEENYELPYIVIVVDEYADLILSKSGKEIENSISRLAAKARAAGIHLVVATQRPSVNVITGVIKSNFPTRVSFKVTTGRDSATILDKYGAEMLLGKGDMLFKQGIETIRIHSSFIEDSEIEALTAKLSTMDKSFHPQAMSYIENGGPDELGGGPVTVSFGNNMGLSSKDDLYRDAVKIVIEHKTASASMLQRRLRIGYNRAANLVEQMEEAGVVGPSNGAKGREVLISSENDI